MSTREKTPYEGLGILCSSLKNMLLIDRHSYDHRSWSAGDLAVRRFHLPTISELPFTTDKDPLVTCCGRAQHRKDKRSDPVSTTTRRGVVARLLYGVNVIRLNLNLESVDLNVHQSGDPSYWPEEWKHLCGKVWVEIKIGQWEELLETVLTLWHPISFGKR